jgi:uncharacterized protein YodC (DUF2158 family)
MRCDLPREYMSERSDFNIGDIVQLKSGGPKMTVVDLLPSVGIGSLEGATCTWFDRNKRQAGNFPLDALKAVSEHDE